MMVAKKKMLLRSWTRSKIVNASLAENRVWEIFGAIPRTHLRNEDEYADKP